MIHHRTGTFLVIVLMGTGLAAAAQQENRATSTNSTAPYQLVQDAYSALQRKDYEAARRSSLKALESDPKNQYALSYLGHASEMLGDFPKAEEAYRALIAINPQHTSAYTGLGLIYGKQGMTDEAIVYFRKQLEITPRNRYASANLGRAYAFQRKWIEAIPHAAMAVELAPDQPDYWQFLGKVQIKAGRVDDARRSFDRALALPHKPAIENDVAYELADAGVDLARAWQLVSSALSQSEHLRCQPEKLSDGDKCTSQLREYASLLDTAGWVLYRQGKVQEAEPYVRSAFAITPRGETELHAIILMVRSRRLNEAARLFAEIRTHPNFDLADSRETVRELTKAAGGDDRLEALLDRVAPPAPEGRDQAKVVAMVDSTGKVTGVGMAEPALPGVTEAAKSLTLPALSWPEHSLRSIRSIEFLSVDGRWIATQSYAGTTPPPPPCGIVPKAPILVTRNAGPAAPSGGCPADF